MCWNHAKSKSKNYWHDKNLFVLKQQSTKMKKKDDVWYKKYTKYAQKCTTRNNILWYFFYIIMIFLTGDARQEDDDAPTSKKYNKKVWGKKIMDETLMQMMHFFTSQLSFCAKINKFGFVQVDSHQKYLNFAGTCLDWFRS